MDNQQVGAIDSTSFDGKNEDLFDVDLIPMIEDETGEQAMPEPKRQKGMSDFDPSAIQADLIPFYEDDMSQDDHKQSQSLQNMEAAQDFVDDSAPIDFDVVINQRLNENGEMIFEPVILGPPGNPSWLMFSTLTDFAS